MPRTITTPPDEGIAPRPTHRIRPIFLMVCLALLGTSQLSLATSFQGGGKPLGICDRAPALKFGDVKGNPIHAFSHSRVTVVEFWATWCGPCIQGMPHLSELWAKYRDRADFVGVSIMENDPSKVRPFVKSMGDKIAYPIAADKVDKGSKGFMYEKWFRAAGQSSIPVVFIVGKDGRIAWIGHPQQMESTLAKVIDGVWDAKGYKVRRDAKMKDEQASARLLKEAYDRISSTPQNHNYADTTNWIELNRQRYDGPETQAALEVFQCLFGAFARADYAEALRQSESEPTNGVVWTYFRPMLLIARIDALQAMGRNAEWRDVAQKAMEAPDPNMLMALSDAMSSPGSKLVDKDTEIGLRTGEMLAKMAREPMFLIRLAYAYHAAGQWDKAKEAIDEALQKMGTEKTKNPQYYAEELRSVKEARAYIYKSIPSKSSGSAQALPLIN